MTAVTLLTDISAKLKSIINGIEIDDSFDGFHEVFEHPINVENMGGSPIAIILPDSTRGEFDTDVEDDRIFNFEVLVLVSNDTATNEADVEKQMKATADHLIHHFAKNYSSDLWWKMLPGVGVWGYQTENGKFRAFTINLEIHVQVNIS